MKLSLLIVLSLFQNHIDSTAFLKYNSKINQAEIKLYHGESDKALILYKSAFSEFRPYLTDVINASIVASIELDYVFLWEQFTIAIKNGVNPKIFLQRKSTRKSFKKFCSENGSHISQNIY